MNQPVIAAHPAIARDPQPDRRDPFGVAGVGSGAIGRPRPIARRDRRGPRYRRNVAARVFAGSVGAYGVVATLGMALARALPMPRPEAVMTAILVALLVFPAITIWAFLTRGPARACVVTIVLSVALAGLTAVLPQPA